jgi:hypothetical protein
MKRILLFMSLTAFTAITLATVASLAFAASQPEKELCKQGGYSNYMTDTGAPFKDQGQCIAYVSGGGTLIPTG